jgi:hypothetical protein
LQQEHVAEFSYQPTKCKQHQGFCQYMDTLRDKMLLSRYPRAHARGTMNFNVFYFQPWHSTTGLRPWSSAVFDKLWE